MLTPLPLGRIYSGQQRELEGPRAKYLHVETALIEYLTVLLEFIDLYGAHKQSEAQDKMPQLPPPPLGGPEFTVSLNHLQCPVVKLLIKVTSFVYNDG